MRECSGTIGHVHRCSGAQATNEIIMGCWAPIRMLDIYYMYLYPSSNNSSKQLLK